MEVAEVHKDEDNSLHHNYCKKAPDQNVKANHWYCSRITQILITAIDIAMGFSSTEVQSISYSTPFFSLIVFFAACSRFAFPVFGVSCFHATIIPRITNDQFLDS